MNRTDRAPGVRLVTDHPAVSYELPPVTEEQLVAPEDLDAVVLKERSYGGLHVQLVWSRTLDVVGITLREGDEGETYSAAVRPEEANDAFDHPYCYLDTAYPSFS